jgi:hypothetical protein
MKKILLFASLGLIIFATSCSKSDDGEGIINPPVTTNPPSSNVVEVTGDITASTTWTADKIYVLKSNVYVINNATLTIEPGTIIKGDKATKGCLIISRGSKINATGTVDKPIVFTSNQPVGGRSQGDWGGVILLGKATNNLGASVLIEGLTDAGDKSKHGGTDDADNSGVMKYVRIEFAGIPLQPDSEINGLTFGSVGSSTTIDYIEVYRSGDDAYEWFGGSVNCKHLLAIDTWDDDFDTDNGFSGKVQYGLAQRLASTADVSGSNGFESDNLSSGSNATPQTRAVFSNMTILGPKETTSPPTINANFQHGAQIRRNSSISILNSVFAGNVDGVYIDDERGTAPDNVSSNLANNKVEFANNVVIGTRNTAIKASATALAAVTTKLNVNNLFDAASYAGSIYTDPYKFAPDLAPAARAGVPNFVQLTASTALNGAVFTGNKADDAFFKTPLVTFKGAFGTENWAAGWAHFDPQTLPYSTPGAVK